MVVMHRKVHVLDAECNLYKFILKLDVGYEVDYIAKRSVAQARNKVD